MPQGADAPSEAPPTSGATAGGRGPSPILIAKQFAKQYYPILTLSPHLLPKFYHPTDSQLLYTTSIEDGNDEDLNFNDLSSKLDFARGAKMDLGSGFIDAQRTADDGVLIVIIGEMILRKRWKEGYMGEEDSTAAVEYELFKRKFVHTFVLTPRVLGTKRNFYVSNDIFRFLELLEEESSPDDTEELPRSTPHFHTNAARPTVSIAETAHPTTSEASDLMMNVEVTSTIATAGSTAPSTDAASTGASSGISVEANARSQNSDDDIEGEGGQPADLHDQLRSRSHIEEADLTAGHSEGNGLRASDLLSDRATPIAMGSVDGSNGLRDSEDMGNGEANGIRGDMADTAPHSVRFQGSKISSWASLVAGRSASAWSPVDQPVAPDMDGGKSSTSSAVGAARMSNSDSNAFPHERVMKSSKRDGDTSDIIPVKGVEATSSTSRRGHKQMNKVLPSNSVTSVYVRNVPNNTTQEEMFELFAQHFPRVPIVHIALYASRAFAFVELASEDAVHAVMEGMNIKRMDCPWESGVVLEVERKNTERQQQHLSNSGGGGGSSSGKSGARFVKGKSWLGPKTNERDDSRNKEHPRRGSGRGGGASGGGSRGRGSGLGRDSGRSFSARPGRT